MKAGALQAASGDGWRRPWHVALLRRTGFLCLLLPALAMAGPRITAIGLATTGELTRAEISLSETPDYRLFTLAGPDRVVLDIRGADLAAGAVPSPAASGPVQQLRFAQRAQEGQLRLVFDLSGPVQLSDRLDGATGAPRLVLEMRTPGAGGAAGATPPSNASSPAATTAAVTPSAAAVPSPPPPPPPAREVVIAVDAGHGGHDPGAIGPRGLREKDVTLAISRKLVERINQEPGMRGFLTRKGDEFVILRQRMERARAASADLFVSIHADAVANRRVRGASVYVLNEKGASDEAARRLAARENAADLIGGVHLSDKDPVLASVLMDLSQNATKSSSIAVGNAVLARLSSTAYVRKPVVQQAPFMVLKSPDVPSLLIETAFISNPDDERNLRSPAHQDKLARAILAGIRDYFHENPPRGTILARSPSAREHVVRRGDTLSAVAARYKVSVRDIREANGLRGDVVRVGQTLRIPGSDS